MFNKELYMTGNKFNRLNFTIFSESRYEYYRYWINLRLNLGTSPKTRKATV